MQFYIQKYFIIILIACNYQKCIASESENNEGRYTQEEIHKLRLSVAYYRAPFEIKFYQVKQPELYLEERNINGIISWKEFITTLTAIKEEGIISNATYLASLARLQNRAAK